MMGTKERHFAPLINVSVEELVPQDHFYRYLERTLDLSFVRGFVQETMQPAHVSLWLPPPAHDGTHRAPWRSNPPVSSAGK